MRYDGRKELQDKRYAQLCGALTRLFLAVGAQIAGSQSVLLEATGVPRTTMFKIRQGLSSVATVRNEAVMTSLASYCMGPDDAVPWTAAARDTVVFSVLPALCNRDAWNRWRSRNKALKAFAESIVRESGSHEKDSVVGAALILWLVACGDECGVVDPELSGAATERYLEACQQLGKAIDDAGGNSPLGDVLRIKCEHDAWVEQFNSIPHDQRACHKERFVPFVDEVLKLLRAGKCIVIAWPKNVLAWASSAGETHLFDELRGHLEKAWRWHYGADARPDYLDRAAFDQDFDNFRAYMKIGPSPSPERSKAPRGLRRGATALVVGSVLSVLMSVATVRGGLLPEAGPPAGYGNMDRMGFNMDRMMPSALCNMDRM